MSLDFDKITKARWAQHQVELVVLANEGLKKIDPKTLSGIGVGETAARLAQYYSDASAKPGSSLAAQARIWQMCEGRQVYAGYSCCGDLVMNTLALLGLRDDRLLNRTDDDSDGTISAAEARTKWSVGKNLIKMQTGAAALAKESGYDTWVKKTNDWDLRPQVGDMPIIGGPAGGGYAHTFVVVGWEGDVMLTVDGGSVDAGGQCVKSHRKKLCIARHTKKLWCIADEKTDEREVDVRIYGGRGILGWLDVGTLWQFFVGECHDVR